MKREFLRHGLVYGAANLVSGLGTIVLVPVYTRTLAPAEYGVVDYVAVVQVLIQVIAGLEITQAIARFYAGAETDRDRRDYASTGLWFLLASFAVVCGGLYMAAAAFGADPIGIGEGALVGVALLSVYVRVLFYALQSQLRWELRPDLYSVASIIAVTCSTALVTYVLVVQNAGVVGVFAGLSGGYAAGSAFCLVSLRHTYRWTFDRRKFRQMLTFSVPLVLSSLALFFSSYGDRIIVKSALGFHELGVYGIAARVAAVITLAISGFQLGTAPLVYRRHGQPETPLAMAQLMRLFMATALVAVVGLASFAIELLQIFTTPEYADAWRAIPVLALAMIFANLYIFLPGLTIRHMTARFSAINIATAVTTLLLIAILVRGFGMLGAAFGVLGGAASGFVMHAAASQRVYHIPFDWRRIGAGLAVSSTAIAAVWAAGASGPFFLGIRTVVFAAAVPLLVATLSTAEERMSIQRLVASGSLLRWMRA